MSRKDTPEPPPSGDDAVTFALQGMDAIRRLGGVWMDAWGMAPQPAPFTWLSTGTPARLRRYGGDHDKDAPAALLVPAPIKTEDIWDLSPRASVVRRYRAAGFRVYLLSWPDAKAMTAQDSGLEAYAATMLAACTRTALDDASAAGLHLAGHSLGGTLAALACCLDPDRYESLTLVAAPLNFGPEASLLGRWVLEQAGAGEDTLPAGDTVAGSALSLAAFSAAPEAFWTERTTDIFAVAGDPERARLHWQVERWLMAERALPRQLLVDVLEQLYVKNRFLKGSLRLGGRSVGPGDLTTPTAVVINEHCAVAPASAILPVLEHSAAPARLVQWCQDEPGTAIQHLTPLVGPLALANQWPQILSWLRQPADGTALHIQDERRHTDLKD